MLSAGTAFAVDGFDGSVFPDSDSDCRNSNNSLQFLPVKKKFPSPVSDDLHMYVYVYMQIIN